MIIRLLLGKFQRDNTGRVIKETKLKRLLLKGLYMYK